jgi:formate dehydrogenase beta subunit
MTRTGAAAWCPTGEPDAHFECDEVLVAVGQDNAFPWIERDIGIEFDKWGLPKLDEKTMQSTLPNVFFGGDAAFGPKNIIWAVAHGHEAAVSIDRMLNGEDIAEPPPPMTNLISQKMGIHAWRYDNAISVDRRLRVPLRDISAALKNIKIEVELGFDPAACLQGSAALPELRRADGVRNRLCIECDACMDICPMDCISFTANGDEDDLRPRLQAPALNLQPGSLRLGDPEDRAGDGQGRGRLPALRPVRRALPDRRLGHAEVPAPDDARRLRPAEAGATQNPAAKAA